MIEYMSIPEDRWKDYHVLRLESLEREPIAFGRAIEEEKDLPEEVWKGRIRNSIFALDQDYLVGMIAYLFDQKVKTQHIASLFCFYVRPDYRGQGIGRGLIETALKNIQQNPKIIKISLAVTVDQTAAISLYKKFGFEIAGREKKSLQVNGRYYDDFIMEKIL